MKPNFWQSLNSIKWIVTLFYVLTALNSCSGTSEQNAKDFEQLTVKWRLVENTNSEKETCKAVFTFINKGPVAVNTGNWAMYFNQNTLMPMPSDDPAKGAVEHINGDFYRFVPGNDFTVNPGDSLVFGYRYEGMLIKERDAPIGAYFVLKGKTNAEAIVKSGDVIVSPFSDPYRVFPDSAVVATVPTAASQYILNRHIPVLPADQIGKIIPTPFQTKHAKGSVVLNESTLVYYGSGLEKEAACLVTSVEKLFGTKLPMSEGKGTEPNSITLETKPLTVNGISEEAYKLTIAEGKGVVISGNDAAGVFYGIQSLSALVPAEAYTSQLPVTLGSVEILDAPRFGYRGFLLDVSRNFQQKADIMKLIDLLAMYKINKLNIRITEDEGWRIEINGLPELTQVGGKRGHTSNSKNWLAPSFGSGPNPDSENNNGKGFYTREEFKEIIKYADQRHIQVIPEVCFPSHARAAIKAMEARYDYYMAKNEPEKANEFRLIDPDDQSVYLSAQMYKDNIVCVALPSAYHFYETVVKDFVAMYEEAGLKMTLFNTGGDEVPNGAWGKSPLCNDLMKTLPEIKNARQLQGYFLEKALSVFEKYNLKVTGWEEIVLNKDNIDNIAVNPKFVGKNIMPLVWDNTGANIDLGYRIANAGYPVVLCNVTNLYFDLAYNTDPSEPGLYWGGFQDAIDPYVMTPLDVYKSANFDMFGNFTEKEADYTGKQHLNAETRKNIVGLQAQLWSETLKGPGMMEYYTVPKLFAFAEKAWAKAPAWESEANVSKRVAATWAGWGELSNRIGRRELPRLDVMFGGYNYRIAPPGAVIEEGMLKASTAFPGLIIRYTTDGSEPEVNSAEYKKPVKVEGRIKVRAFNALGRGSKTFSVN
jgi:hexosaminidase